MHGFSVFFRLISVLLVCVVAGCAAPSGPVASQNDIDDLTAGIRALGTDVDPEEAARAARIAYQYTRQLAVEYQITDAPLIHNMKVNNGLRPRGLCWHWAEDMEARLKQENFQTLQLHRAIANADNPFRIDHSTAIISRRGDNFRQGMVLDPWRYGGRLFWAPTRDDTRYGWEQRERVLWKKYQLQQKKQARKRAAAG